MLDIQNISFHFGGRTIYNEASLHIKNKERIGLIGANGAGKSTLLKIIDGEYSPDGGSISRSKDSDIGFLNQDLLSLSSDKTISEVAMQAFEETLKMQDQIDKLIRKLEDDYQEEDVTKLTDLQAEFERMDGYKVTSKTEAVLEGLGFKTEELSRPLDTFSGGWRMRVMLAQLLLRKPDLLMLDEPTNHLDLPSIEWLEQYLTGYEGAVIIVSHDREFLNGSCNVIVEVAGKKLIRYSGNYDFYQKEKVLREEIQQKSYDNQQQKIKETERFIERFRSKATKAKQVQSRIKALERMSLVEAIGADAPEMNLDFSFQQQPGKIILELVDVNKAYGEKVILEHTNLFIERGDKIALIGPNGIGKSTLLRIVAGSEHIDGERREGHNVITTFFAQHQLEALRLENNPIEELASEAPQKTENELRTILGCFLFSGDDAEKKISVLSGGEKSRVALAKTLLSEANFLLLDEPTNHLDIQSVDILTSALQNYGGTFIVISHNRHFIANVATKIAYIDNKELKLYPGTYEEFQYWYAKQKAESKTQVQESKSAKGKKSSSSNAKTDNALNKERKKLRNRLKGLQRDAEKLEAEIISLEERVESLENKMADPEIYENQEKLQTVRDEYNDTKQKIEKLTSSWESKLSELDELEADLG